MPGANNADTIHFFPEDPFLPVPAEDSPVGMVRVPGGNRHSVPGVRQREGQLPDDPRGRVDFRREDLSGDQDSHPVLSARPFEVPVAHRKQIHPRLQGKGEGNVRDEAVRLFLVEVVLSTIGTPITYWTA